MKVDDFIKRFRTHLRDAADPPFWVDEEIVGFLNEAVQEACERSKLIEDRSTPEVCSIVTVPGQSTYKLHASVFQIKRLALQGRPLEETCVEALDCDSPGWENRSGKPRCFIVEQASGVSPANIRLVATPNLVETLALTVYRGALKPLIADAGIFKPEIPERFHERLLDWVYHRAYLKQDADAFDPKKAAESLGLFIQSFGERPDANVQRKRRDKRPPVVRMRW